MTSPINLSQENDVANNAKQSDREINFRKQEAMYLRQLDQERQEKEKLRQENESLKKTPQHVQEEDDDSDEVTPYPTLYARIQAGLMPNIPLQQQIQLPLQQQIQLPLQQQYWGEPR